MNKRHFCTGPISLHIFIGIMCIFVFLAFLFNGCAGSPDFGPGQARGVAQYPDLIVDMSDGTPKECEQLFFYLTEIVKEKGSRCEGEVQWWIPHWPENKQAAVSLTFDDGTLDQYEVAVPMLNQQGLKATFFIITGPRGSGVWQDGRHARCLFDWDDAVEIAMHGHEIGSHGVSHNDLRRLWWNDRNGKIEVELRNSREEIVQHIPRQFLPGGAKLSFSWPYWRSTPQLEKMAQEYYLAGRSGRGAFPLRAIRQPLAVHSYRVLSWDSIQMWHRELEAAKQSGGWLLFSLHGVDNKMMDKQSIGWQPLTVDKFRALLQMVSTKDLWTAPFGAVYRYAQEQKQAQLQIEGVFSNIIFLRLRDGLDDEVYNVPLTVQLSVPNSSSGAFSGMVVEDLDGHPVSEVRVIETLPDRQTIEFELVPDDELVAIRKTLTTVQLYND